MAWLDALHAPACVLDWSLDDWQRVLRLARRLRLLARLAEAIDGAGLMGRIPSPPARLLAGELRLSRWRLAALRWTIERVGAALQGVSYPCVLLKGAAYVVQSLPIAAGRLPSDLDILVPRTELPDAQRRLVAVGWAEVELDEHDQRYYREWSHEAPPMHHPLFGLELDVHHAILPPYGPSSVDTPSLLAWSRVLPDAGVWQVLDPVDQVLHSAAHLFFDSSVDDRLRDLVDLDGLIRHFGGGANAVGFWERLLARSERFRLLEPLALAEHFLNAWFDTPIPAKVRRELRRRDPGVVSRAWVTAALHRVLDPIEPDALPGGDRVLASTLLLARYHLRRLPLRLLLPHLWRKWRLRHLSDDGGSPPRPEA